MTHIRYYILLLLTLLSTLAWAEGEEDAPKVTIGGSVYGGGKMGAILDTDDFNSVDVTYPGAGRTEVIIHNAIIGTDETVEDGMGNVFGGGFGPAARVMHSKVQMFDGVIRNSLYGGGEIAAVGHGVMDPPIDKVPRLNEVKRQGSATVEMYHGHVERDVFGGGRGFTYASDDGTISSSRLYTDGYVFGSTKVRIYGGVIGTRESMQEGYGNVFGGGNVGFMYSGNEKKIAGEGVDIKNVQFLEEGKPYYVIPHVKDASHTTGKEPYFYADPADATSERAGDLSIACDVLIEPWCRVKEAVRVHGEDYSAGDYVKTEDLNFLEYKEKTTSGDTETFTKVNTDIWNKLEDDGITIYNAVFAGGNVSTGDDKVYAETTTVYGNAVATVNDLYYRDLVTIGTSVGREHTGGLYGDGNLTFVDGYRELSLSNYGTDYDNLIPEVTSAVYETLNDREKTYYQSKYKCINAQSPYAVDDVVDESIYETFTDEEKAENWVFAGFRSRYAGRLLNTIQRSDFVGVFGSRLVLQGAMDRVLTTAGDQLSFEDYTINRVGELSLNKQPTPGQSVGSSICRGNYFGIYNKVHYLGALTSDVRFGIDTAESGDGADVWEDTEDESPLTVNQVDYDLDNPTKQSYYNWKSSNFNISQLKNLGTSKHLIALASGVALELKQEPVGDSPSNWGPITGVIQLDLLNVVQGEGGGFVYARNEHGLPSRRKVNEVNYVRHFLSSYNYDGAAATHEEYLYDCNNLQDMQTSGNFIKNSKSEHGEVQYIVDDCYPVHDQPSSIGCGDPVALTKAHYWYIHGTIYVYNMYISAYTGAARMYQGSTGLQIPLGEDGTLNLKEVNYGYYCYNPPTEDNPSPLPVIVNDVEYNHGDPISWWDYHKYLEIPDDPKKSSFKSQISDFGEELNNMSHDNGFVLSLELNDPGSASDPFTFWNPTSYPTPDYVEKGPSFSTSIETGSEQRYGQTHYSKNSYISADDVESPDFGSTEGLTEVEGYQLCVESLQLTAGGNFLLTKGVLVPNEDVPGLVKRYMAIKLNTTEDQVNVDDPSNEELKNEAEDEINKRLDRCYKVTKEDGGDYGGKSYIGGKKYDPLEGWSKLSGSDRKPENGAASDWSYNQDAIDLLNNSDLEERYIDKPQTNISLNAFSEAIVSLYMSKDSRLLNLQQNKNMTVHFVYSYGDTQEDHYINITIDFKNELPDVGRLEDPGLVFPGTKIAFKQPTVKAAYNVSGGGWEYYENEEDAGGHINGKRFTNRDEPFYWYQDGFYVSYYAETMFGRSYSENSVEVKVANYHDLKRVLGDSDYLGIGMRKNYPDGTPEEEKQRSPKVYINDYSDESGLDLLKDLYERTLDEDDILQSTVEGCKDLEIILRSDLEPGDPWTSIGSGTGEPCFQGNLHGDGYTISGLTSSLFQSLCGNVYNLGVTGSFTSSGIAESSEGRIENCWVYTTGLPGNAVEPVATLASGGVIANSYYNIKNTTTNTGYTATSTGAIGKDDNAFYNGEIAYEVNGYYLKKGGKASATVGSLDNLSLNNNQDNYQDYVQERYADGDFVYAGGELLPQKEDIRYREEIVHDDIEDVDKVVDCWYAQYPDDYIFFGQSLTYGHGNVTHQDLPGRIGEVDGESNRVYRAPAYFQNATPSRAYYNDNAVFAAKSSDDLHDVYPHMTAIDFTGNGTTSTILDHADPLVSFKNADLTQNLLVYAGAGDKSVLKAYLDDNEPTYSETTSKYHNVPVVPDEDIVDPNLGPVIRGHAVYLNNVDDGQAYQAEYDHFLVDRQEFFAPIAYSFIGNKRMWYQRKPDNYVEINEGWEVVSLPFTADLVTTQDKGEITHFYEETDRATLLDSKKSHEYWLREYGQDVVDSDPGTGFYVAVFNYPDQVTGEDAKYKDVSNTFLWDYYYSKEVSSERVSQMDENLDNYREFYQSSRSYEGYPFLKAGTPYLIGFPGKKYYEFDLSGVFEAKPKHSLETIPKIGAQVITFASKGTIPVSDPLAVNGGTDVPYNFWANFIDTEMPTGSYVLNEKDIVDEDDESVVLEPAGNGFYPAAVGAKTVPFRPFFTTSTKAARQRTRGILFGYGDRDEREKHEAEPREADEPGRLIIRSGRQRIIVSSSLSESTTVRIVNVSGITLHTFDIAPGETIEKFIPNQGVYIVQTINGRYTKKLAVK